MKNIKKITVGLLLLCMLCFCTIGFTGCFGGGNPDKYTLTLSAELEDGTSITTNENIFLYGDGVYTKGSRVEYGALSLDDRYEFVKWEEDNNQNAQRYINNFSQGVTFTAIFKRKYVLTYAEFYIGNNLSDVDDITMNLNLSIVNPTQGSIYFSNANTGLNSNYIITSNNSLYKTEKVVFNTFYKGCYLDGHLQSLNISWWFNGVKWNNGGMVNAYSVNIDRDININPASGTKVTETLTSIGGYYSDWYALSGNADNLIGGTDVNNALTVNVRFIFQ